MGGRYSPIIDSHRSYGDVAGARRGLLVLTALRWVPLGLLVPLFVLYPVHAGLSLVDVGVLFATLTGCVVLFELPTGGLADSWGRRRALLLAATVGVVALGLLTVADSMLLFVLAFAV